jgi:hypothetical protein
MRHRSTRLTAGGGDIAGLGLHVLRELTVTLELVRGECQSASAAVDLDGAFDSTMFPESGR